MRKNVLICLGLSLLVIAIYWRTFSFGFVDFDDGPYVIDNPCIQEGLTWEGVRCSLTTLVGGNWCPTISLSYMLDYELYGGINAGGMHFTNVFLHLVNSVFVFFMSRTIVRSNWGGAFIAAVFALHPQRVESVAWVTERKDVLMGLFWLLTIWTYFRYTKKSNLGRYILVVIFYFLALTSKTMAVTIPCILLLLDFWPLKRWAGRKSIGWIFLEKIPLFIISGIFSSGSIFTQRSTDGIHTSGIALMNRVGNAAFFYLQYISDFLWPNGLAVYYPHPGALPLWELGFAGIILLSISGLAVMWLKARPWFFVGWAWFIGTLVPVIGIQEFGINFPWADRYMYMPHVGLSMIIVLFTIPLLRIRRQQKKIMAISGTAIILVLSAVSWKQVSYWRNSIMLFERAAEVTVRNDLAHRNLGKFYWEMEEPEKAIPHFQEAYRDSPEHPVNLYNMGFVSVYQGKLGEAVYFFKSSIEAFKKGHVEKSMLPAAHNNLGVVLTQLGQKKKADFHFAEAERLRK